MKSARYPVYIVAGAPGAGKSTVVEAWLAAESAYMIFDIDWLASPVSALIGSDLRQLPQAWPAYAQLWFEVIHAALRNGQRIVFFTPNDPADFLAFAVPDWCDPLHWLLLDCSDDIRRKRLSARQDWTEGQVDEALQDAAGLRRQLDTILDSSLLSVDETLAGILAWLGCLNAGDPLS
jgi:hypothetical protein